MLLDLRFGEAQFVNSNLTATLTFTGKENVQVNTGLPTANLNFTGAPVVKQTTKTLTVAVLSFTGPVNLIKVINKGLTVATLTFTGVFKKLIPRTLTAV